MDKTKRLPNDKISKLADDVVKDLHKTLRENVDNLKRHEIVEGDRTSILDEAWRRAGRTFPRKDL